MAGASLSFVYRSRMERRGDTHRILEAGPQVLHGIVELSLLPQGSKDVLLDVLRWDGQQEVRQGEVEWGRGVKAEGQQGGPRFGRTDCTS